MNMRYKFIHGEEKKKRPAEVYWSFQNGLSSEVIHLGSIFRGFDELLRGLELTHQTTDLD